MPLTTRLYHDRRYKKEYKNNNSIKVSIFQNIYGTFSWTVRTRTTKEKLLKICRVMVAPIVLHATNLGQRILDGNTSSWHAIFVICEGSTKTDRIRNENITGELGISTRVKKWKTTDRNGNISRKRMETAYLNRLWLQTRMANETWEDSGREGIINETRTLERLIFWLKTRKL